jgi:hypothetical protein
MRAGIQRAYQDREEMEQRALQLPHRPRYLRLIDDYARRAARVARRRSGGARAAPVGSSDPQPTGRPSVRRR